MLTFCETMCPEKCSVVCLGLNKTCVSHTHVQMQHENIY